MAPKMTELGQCQGTSAISKNHHINYNGGLIWSTKIPGDKLMVKDKGIVMVILNLIFSYSYLHSLVFLFALGTEVYFVFVLSLWALKCVARPLPSRSNPPSLLASIQPNIFLLPVANQVDTRSKQSAHIVTCSKIQTINPPKM